MSHTLRSQGRRKIQNQDEGIKIIFKAVPSYPENHLRLIYSLKIPDSSHTHTHRYTHACAFSNVYKFNTSDFPIPRGILSCR